jgi:hypothetical protein
MAIENFLVKMVETRMKMEGGLAMPQGAWSIYEKIKSGSPVSKIEVDSLKSHLKPRQGVK